MRASPVRTPAVLLATAALTLGLLAMPSTAGAQTPTAEATPSAGPATPPPDAQQLAVEQQLLCPLCVNERLDVCTLAICADMKEVIRERLAAGSTPDDIILFFETRYGPHVRAELPREGFNLVLFGWVGGAILLTGLAAAYVLYTMRRDSTRRRLAGAPSPTPPGAAGAEADDRWVDDLLDEADDDPPRGTR